MEEDAIEVFHYYGFHLSSSFLMYNSHIHYKAIGLLHALSKSAKLTRGLGNKALHTIYKGAIERILTYGSPVWQEAIDLLHALSKSAKLTWGLGKKALHTIYKGAIEPILT